MTILLEKGQRGILIGQTGSGKTLNAVYHLQHTPLDHVIVLDTKGEPAFDHLARDDETIDWYDGGKQFEKVFKGKAIPNYMIVRPSPDEIQEPLIMDDILNSIYKQARTCLVYIDEAYQWHIAGRAGAGLTGLLTRGRSKGITTLLATQRPSWISRFCFSESQKFYVHKLLDDRDKKTIQGYIPDFSLKSIPKYHFWYYDNASDMETAQLMQPVPKPIVKASEKFEKHVWI